MGTPSCKSLATVAKGFYLSIGDFHLFLAYDAIARLCARTTGMGFAGFAGLTGLVGLARFAGFTRLTAT